MRTIQDKMLEFCITPPTEIIYDDEIHRFKNDGDSSKNSWYVAYDNGKFQSGAFGCWKLDISEKFCSVERAHLLPNKSNNMLNNYLNRNTLLSLRKLNNKAMFRNKLMKDLTAQQQKA